MKSLRKILAVMLAFAMIFALSACGSKQEEPAPAAPATPAAPAAPAASTGTGQTYDLILAHALSATTSQQQGCEYFAKIVNERTNGEVNIDIYSDSQLGGEREIFEGQKVGSVDIGLYGCAGPVSYDSVFNLYAGAPFSLATWEDADEVFFGATGDKITGLNGFLGKLFSERLQALDITMLGNFDNGFRGISNAKHAVHSAADVVGLKLRVPETEMILRTFEALGAVVTPMSFAELYTALQQGTVDGQDNGVPLTFSSGFGEVQSYYTEINYSYGALYLTIANEALDKLPAEYQQVIKDCAIEASVWHNKLHREQYDSAKQGLIDQGVEFYTPTAEEMQTFVDAVTPVWEWLDEECGKEYVDLFREYLAKK